MAKTVSIDHMGDEIAKMMTEYGDIIATNLKEEVKLAGKDAVKELRATSPKKTGDYRKGWTSKVVNQKAHSIQVVLHNKTEYQLAHLLEHGHALVIGGRSMESVGPFPHIAEAEKNAEENLGKRIEIMVRKQK